MVKCDVLDGYSRKLETRNKNSEELNFHENFDYHGENKGLQLQIESVTSREYQWSSCIMV